MNLEIKGQGSRTYLFVDDKCVKMLPKEFHHLEAQEVYNCVEEPKKKILSKKERASLGVVALVDHLKNYEKYVYELIEKSKPKTARLVNVKNQEFERFEIEFSKGRCIKCSKELYEVFEPKVTVFSNY